MCQACRQRREKEAVRAALNQKKGVLSHEVLELLIADKIKGSEWDRLTQMINSPDPENLTVVEEIIKQKNKQHEQLYM